MGLIDHRLALADQPPEEAQPSVEHARADRVGLRVDLVERDADQLDRARAIPGEVGQVGGLPDHLDPIDPDSVGGVRDAIPQGQHPFDLPMRIVVGMVGCGRP